MTAEALARVRRYVAMRDAQPLGRTDDQVHGIHVGTEWEAVLTLSDLRAVLAMVPAQKIDANIPISPWNRECVLCGQQWIGTASDECPECDGTSRPVAP